jgi:mannose-6-phosphate isomerase-like protein (cupin superfamily)
MISIFNIGDPEPNEWSTMASHDPRDYVLGQELRVRILTTGAETSGRHDLIDASPLPYTATPLHLHTRYEERFFVLEGACTVWVGPDTMQLGPGDYCAIPLDTPHAIKAGPNGCRSLLVSSPAGFAELIARAATPAHLAGPETETDLERFAAVSAELGDQILGPPGTLPADL